MLSEPKLFSEITISIQKLLVSDKRINSACFSTQMHVALEALHLTVGVSDESHLRMTERS